MNPFHLLTQSSIITYNLYIMAILRFLMRDFFIKGGESKLAYRG